MIGTLKKVPLIEATCLIMPQAIADLQDSFLGKKVDSPSLAQVLMGSKSEESCGCGSCVLRVQCFQSLSRS